MPPSSVTVVSGGSRGLGLAIVESLLARGDRVATFSRSGSPALSALGSTHADELHVEHADAGDPLALGNFVKRVAARFGRIDHCVANAAVAHEGVLATMRDDEIDSMLAVNVKGSIVLVRECVRQMLIQSPREAPNSSEGARSGESGHLSITLISSVVAERGSPGLSVYAATKAALEGFGVNLARELGPRGIRVNVVAPGFLETDLSAALTAENRARIARRTAAGRLGFASDVVGLVAFLTGDSAGFVTGQVVRVDGGA